VLVGTVSIEKSEYLSGLLKQRGIPHQVLNARYHEQEAQIVALAGVPRGVTIATNMAGRGTDIQLGGNVEMRLKAALKGDETPDQIAALKRQITVDVEQKKRVALDAGGLYVLGTERHESRRIDNQLRGRTGRQGDPGKSKFYICLEDDLLRIFAADRLDAIMRGLGIQEGEAIVHPWMNKALETSQRRVEQRNFEIRKNLLKYDDVINDQRKAIFEQRIEFMRTADVASIIKDMRHDVVEKLVWRHMPEKAYPEQWNTPELLDEADEIFGFRPAVDHWAAEEGIAQQEIIERLTREVDHAYAQKAAMLGPERLRAVEKQVLLSVVDMRWREHLSLLDHLRSVIHLRGYAQRDPLNEFKTEAFTLFERMLLDLRTTITRMLLKLQIGQADDQLPRPQMPARTYEIHQNPDTGENEMQHERDALPPLAPEGFDRHNPSTWGKVSRNAPCPCGSGKKFKYCHGTAEAASA
jgi:preprotein translocase subunit SecA